MKKCLMTRFSLLCWIPLLLLFGTGIQAETLDSSQDVTLVLNMVIHQKNGKDLLLHGGSLECIPVAFVDMSEPASPVYAYTPAFEDESMPLDNFDDNPKAAKELNTYATENEIHGFTAPVENGKADFGTLSFHGLFLIRQHESIPNCQDIQPFLISAPSHLELDNGELTHIYAVEAEPKTELMTAPIQSGEDPEDPSSSQSPQSSQSSQQTGSSTSSSQSSSHPANPSGQKNTGTNNAGGSSGKKSTGAKTGVYSHPVLFALMAMSAMLGMMGLFSWRLKNRH